jgi:putative aldouronate transport system permease protein
MSEAMSDGGRNETSRGIQKRFESYFASLQREKFLLLLVLPGVAYYVIFHYIPMYGITVAFKDFRMSQGILGSPWVGFRNFQAFFEYPHVLRLIRNTFLLSFYNLLFGFPAPILFALLLNEIRLKGYRKLVQTVSFFPHFIALPPAVGLFFIILSPSSGIVNILLNRVLGIEPIYFLLEPGWFRAIFVGTDIWQSFGWGAIVYIAQLSRIDQELYEAATVDGATRVQKMWHVSLPGLKPIISILLILRVGRLLSVGWQKVILMYNPLTYETADVIGSFVYRRGLAEGAFALGTAVGFLNSVVSLLLVLMANSIAKKVSEWTVL